MALAQATHLTLGRGTHRRNETCSAGMSVMVGEPMDTDNLGTIMKELIGRDLGSNTGFLNRASTIL